MSNGDKIIEFNRVTSTFEVKFDGKIQSQKNILKELIRKDIDVMDFSVPRTNTLEDLYIKLITEDEIREPVEIASTGVI